MTTRSIRIVILLSTIVLIIGNSVLAFQFTRTIQHTAHMNATATQNAALATVGAATARTDAATTTVLTTVAGTEMASSHATATMAALPDPYANGRLVLYDNLASGQPATQPWMLPQDPACFFQDNAYHVTQSGEGCVIATADHSALFFDDFTLEVKMTILQGDLGGISLRALTSSLYGSGPRYFLYFDKDGNYQFNVYTGSTLIVLSQGKSSAFNTGYGQTNTIGLVARGSTFTWYVNHQQTGSTNDTRYKKGAINLLSAIYNTHTGNTEAAYTNLRIWRL
jgi:hypothetical protein